MNCSDIHIHLFAFTEGELPPAKLKEFNQHVSNCAACSQLIDAFDSLETAIEAEKAAAPNAFAATRILQHLENANEQRAKQAYAVLRPIFLTLALFLAMALGFLIGNHGLSRTEYTDNEQGIEMLKTDLYIADFIDEDISSLSNQ